jgi:hypothetical protein
LGPLGTAATMRPIVSAKDDYDDGEIGEMIGRGNRSTRRKPAPVPLCPLLTPHAARMRTRAAATKSLSYGTAHVSAKCVLRIHTFLVSVDRIPDTDELHFLIS